MTDAKCIDFRATYIVHGILNVITDFATMLIPLPLLWQLNLPRSRKLQLVGIFLSGSLYVNVKSIAYPR